MEQRKIILCSCTIPRNFMDSDPAGGAHMPLGFRYCRPIWCGNGWRWTTHKWVLWSWFAGSVTAFGLWRLVITIIIIMFTCNRVHCHYTGDSCGTPSYVNAIPGESSLSIHSDFIEKKKDGINKIIKVIITICWIAKINGKYW